MFSCLGRIIKLVFQISLVIGLFVGGFVLVENLGIISDLQSGTPLPDIPANSPSGSYTSSPEDKDIIRAVRNGVNGRTYTMPTGSWEWRTRYCTHQDVAFDIHAKNNPELAKCAEVGDSYREKHYVSGTETHRCGTLPDVGWSVASLGDDRWRASQGGNSWVVTKIDGSRGAIEGMIEVSVSDFSFQVEPNQTC